MAAHFPQPVSDSGKPHLAAGLAGEAHPAARALDLHDLGAHVGEDHRAEGPREVLGQVDDAEALECGPHDGASIGRRPWTVNRIPGPSSAHVPVARFPSCATTLPLTGGGSAEGRPAMRTVISDFHPRLGVGSVIALMNMS
jgi:hypothetical protein